MTDDHPTTAPDPVARVLVVDDDRAVRESLERALGLHGFEVHVAADGLAAINALPTTAPDIIVLDVMMPGVDGLGVVRRLRQEGDDTPILLLTARDAVPDRVAGLTTGADDYLVKPFALEELVARLHSLLRRHTANRADDPDVVRFADLVVDLRRVQVTRDGEQLDLTPTELELLLTFLRQPRRVLSRGYLHEQVWGADSDVTDNTVEVYVGYLRRKLEAGGRSRLLHTVRGFGYVLREPG